MISLMLTLLGAFSVYKILYLVVASLMVHLQMHLFVSDLEIVQSELFFSLPPKLLFLYQCLLLLSNLVQSNFDSFCLLNKFEVNLVRVQVILEVLGVIKHLKSKINDYQILIQINSKYSLFEEEIEICEKDKIYDYFDVQRNSDFLKLIIKDNIFCMNTSILSQKDLNQSTKDTRQMNANWLTPQNLTQTRKQFRIVEGKLLAMFVSVKEQLESIYKKVVRSIHQLSHHLNKQNIKVLPNFLTILKDVQREIDYKFGNLNENLRTILIDGAYFEEMNDYLGMMSVRKFEGSSQKKSSSNSCSSKKLMTYKASTTFVDIDNFESGNYQRTLKIQPNAKNIECTAWLQGQWERLQVLCLVNKKIINLIPLSHFIAPNIKEINLSENLLRSLDPFRDSSYPNLIKLTLNNNQITHLDPLAQSSLPKLYSLNLGQNRIKNIAPFIQCYFSELHDLNISDNRLINLHPLSQTTFPRLQILNIDKNSLRSLDELINCNFKELRILSFSFNEVSSIDCLSSCRFSKLEGFLGDNNKIKSIESLRFCKFLQIKEILLNNNQIEEISVIEKLPFNALKQFDLQNNKIRDNEIMCFTAKSSSFNRAKKRYPFIQL